MPYEHHRDYLISICHKKLQTTGLVGGLFLSLVCNSAFVRWTRQRRKVQLRLAYAVSPAVGLASFREVGFRFFAETVVVALVFLARVARALVVVVFCDCSAVANRPARLSLCITVRRLAGFTRGDIAGDGGKPLSVITRCGPSRVILFPLPLNMACPRHVTSLELDILRRFLDVACFFGDWSSDSKGEGSSSSLKSLKLPFASFLMPSPGPPTASAPGPSRPGGEEPDAAELPLGLRRCSATKLVMSS